MRNIPSGYAWSTNGKMFDATMHPTRRAALVNGAWDAGIEPGGKLYTGAAFRITSEEIAKAAITEARVADLLHEVARDKIEELAGDRIAELWAEAVKQSDVNRLKGSLVRVMTKWMRESGPRKLFRIEEIEEHVVGAKP